MFMLENPNHSIEMAYSTYFRFGECCGKISFAIYKANKQTNAHTWKNI